MKVLLLRGKGRTPISLKIDRWTVLMASLFFLSISMIVSSVLIGFESQIADTQYSRHISPSMFKVESPRGGVSGISVEPNLKHLKEALLVESIIKHESKLAQQAVRLRNLMRSSSSKVEIEKGLKSNFDRDGGLDEPQLHTIPVDVGYITSKYGMRIDPINGKYQKHNGIDIAAKKGSTIKAIGSGFVTFSGRKGGYGNVIEIHHSDTLKSRYAHLDKILVSEGAVVRKGAEIAKMGRTGRATGSHLHLEIWRNGLTVNPEKYLGLLNDRIVSN